MGHRHLYEAFLEGEGVGKMEGASVLAESEFSDGELSEDEVSSECPDQRWHHYVRRMATPGEWGDHITLQAIADAYKLRITVIGSALDVDVTPRNEKGRPVSPSEWTGTAFVSYLSEKGGEHYNPVDLS
eukprot:Sspe_Gene.88718::Locus_60662_Transcript_1_1_Confidence_1.000_Length_460::g.88718::m.88718